MIATNCTGDLPDNKTVSLGIDLYINFSHVLFIFLVPLLGFPARACFISQIDGTVQAFVGVLS